MKEKVLCKLKKLQPACILILLAMMLTVLCPVQAKAAEDSKKITLNKTTASQFYGRSFYLKAFDASKNVIPNSEITWTSDNKKIAAVNAKGKVKITGIGTVTVTASLANGEKASCEVTGFMYQSSKDQKYVKVSSASGKIRKYRRYKQYFNDGSSNYSGNFGCVLAAVAITESGFGKTYSPYQLHYGSSSEKFSERYGLKKVTPSLALWGKAAISVRTATEMFKNVGIKAKARYSFGLKKAEKEITAHLKKGKPVLLKANNKTHNGIRFANGHHAIVLIGINPDGSLIFIDPEFGKINYAHGNGVYVNDMKLRTLLKYHVNQPGDSNAAYVTGLSKAGGYILVG